MHLCTLHWYIALMSGLLANYYCDRPASLDFNQACYTKFAAVLPFCSCKNTTGAFSLSSVKRFASCFKSALQAVSSPFCSRSHDCASYF